MIQVRLSLADVSRMRFAYSPLAELTESLYLLSSQRMQPHQRAWYEHVRGRLRNVDLPLLRAVVPTHPFIATFLFAGARDPGTCINQQLEQVARMPPEDVRADLAVVWKGLEMPPILRRLVSEGSAGLRRLADALAAYWSAALEPDWPAMRALLDDDVAYRAGELTKHGFAGLLEQVHPEISVRDGVLQIDKRQHRDHRESHDLTGTGMLLIPSVFVWPNVIFAANLTEPPSLTYPARGVGRLWTTSQPTAQSEDALAALLGRRRASILAALELPMSTSDLALRLGFSASGVSQHLSVLHRSGLLTSWRAGRRVLYRRSPLGTSILTACGDEHKDTGR